MQMEHTCTLLLMNCARFFLLFSCTRSLPSLLSPSLLLSRELSDPKELASSPQPLFGQCTKPITCR